MPLNLEMISAKCFKRVKMTPIEVTLIGFAGGLATMIIISIYKWVFKVIKK